MFVCPNCDEPVGQADIENGQCPHCGSEFPADGEVEKPEDA